MYSVASRQVFIYWLGFYVLILLPSLCIFAQLSILNIPVGIW